LVLQSLFAQAAGVLINSQYISGVTLAGTRLALWQTKGYKTQIFANKTISTQYPCAFPGIFA
jgi:hypothetical protein